MLRSEKLVYLLLYDFSHNTTLYKHICFLERLFKHFENMISSFVIVFAFRIRILQKTKPEFGIQGPDTPHGAGIQRPVCHLAGEPVGASGPMNKHTYIYIYIYIQNKQIYIYIYTCIYE